MFSKGWIGAKNAQICPYADTNATFTARVEPRAGIAVRLTPWMTAKAMVGFDALAGGAMSVSTLLEFHNRSYDAFYPRQKTVEE